MTAKVVFTLNCRVRVIGGSPTGLWGPIKELYVSTEASNDQEATTKANELLEKGMAYFLEKIDELHEVWARG